MALADGRAAPAHCRQAWLEDSLPSDSAAPNGSPSRGGPASTGRKLTGTRQLGQQAHMTAHAPVIGAIPI